MSSIRTANVHRAIEFTTDDNNTPIGLVARQRFAGLLQGGFLLPQDTAHTGSRDKYCLLYTSPSPRDRQKSRMPSSA